MIVPVHKFSMTEFAFAGRRIGLTFRQQKHILTPSLQKHLQRPASGKIMSTMTAAKLGGNRRTESCSFGERLFLPSAASAPAGSRSCIACAFRFRRATHERLYLHSGRQRIVLSRNILR